MAFAWTGMGARVGARWKQIVVLTAGVLIVAGQAHVLLDRAPLHSGAENLAAIPAAFFSLSPTAMGQAEGAFVVGLATIVAMLLWERVRPKALKLVPGALVGVLVGTAIAAGICSGSMMPVGPADLPMIWRICSATG